MKLIDSEHEPGWRHMFLEWPRRHYASDPNWLGDPAEDRIMERTDGGLGRHFLVVEDARILGRISAFVNPLLRDKRGQPYGQLGFFECERDARAGGMLVSGAMAWLRQELPPSALLLAPMDRDTWHAYRLRTYGFDEPCFAMEPYNPAYYPELFSALGLEPAARYVTKTVTDLPSLLRRWEPHHRRALRHGYSFRTFNAADRAAELDRIYRLSTTIFRENPFYAHMPKAEFDTLYAGLATRLDPELLTFAIDASGELVGFCFAMRDHRHHDTVNIKTFGVLPRAQGLGVGPAMAMDIYERILAKGCTRVNHCLMRAGNQADLMDRLEARVTREYALYSRALGV